LDAGGHRGEVLVRHVSSDGALIWRVEKSLLPDGTAAYVAGFEGLLWHIHPESLDRPGAPLDRVLAVTDDLLADRMLVIEETWPSTGPDDPARSLRLMTDLDEEIAFKANDETWRLRFWSGRSVDVDDLIDGKVVYLPLEESGMARN
jgi:hypothetical protein